MRTNPYKLLALGALAAVTTVGAAGLAFAGGSNSSSYELSVIAQGLETPTGIAVDGYGNVYFSQVPTPGVAGPMGGMNTVSVLDAETSKIEHLTMGEPEPTNLAVSRNGTLFWTCKSAGVILMHSNGATSLVKSGLSKPSGIAIKSGLTNLSPIYFTQVPTPGVPGTMGGMNTVSVLQGGNVTNLTVGEPEPTDIAISKNNTLYWTCKSAGVILKRTNSGQVSVLLSGLNSPTGIALDRAGSLYFTEVPTPGVPGSQGGQNKVWKYDLGSGAMTAINEGDPEPTDIAVSDDGLHVYWTCTSAGVIVRADLM